MKNATDIIEAAGGSLAVQTAFGVKLRVVQTYTHAGKFPATWFDGLEKMAGKRLPRRLFSFKPRLKPRRGG
jgi:hypothetical protein